MLCSRAKREHSTDQLFVAGDKAGQWNAWYRHAVPLAEQRYEIYLKERTEEEGERP